MIKENMEPILKDEKHLSLIQKPKLSKNITFGEVADIYMAKKIQF